MEVRRLTPHIGARVRGIDLATATPADRPMLRGLLEEHLVLFFEGQAFDLHAYKRFGEAVGDLEVTPLLPGLGDDLAEVHIVEAPPGRTRGYADAWHTDVPFRELPPYATILRPEYLPSLGGDTLWASMYAAYEGLSDSLRRLADELDVVQGVSAPAGTFEHVHPAVRVHPVTGRRGLNINSVFSKRIVGASRVESAELIRMFVALATLPDYQLRFAWSPDIVAVWDNRFTQHYASADYDEPRRMQRMTVVGEAVLGPRSARTATAAAAA
jgi:taurine dioxygenase